MAEENEPETLPEPRRPDALLISVPDVEDLGPAMRALSPRQRKFVIAYFHTGDRRASARMSGYSDPNENALGVTAHRVFHNAKVQEAMREYGRETALGALIPTAFKAIEEALAQGDTKEKIKAAGMVLDRTGFHATMEHKVVKVDETREQTIRSIMKLAKEQGLDPRTLIGGAVDFLPEDAKLVDAEVVTVEPASSDEGLEGLI